jgi:hypothetical protein
MKKTIMKASEQNMPQFNILIFQAHSYNGEGLLAQDKCGEAIRGLQEGVKCKAHFTLKNTKNLMLKTTNTLSD